MNLRDSQKNGNQKKYGRLYKKSGIYIICVIILFIGIGLLTTAAPAYRLSSQTIANWTSEIESTTFLYLLGMENRAFMAAYPDDKPLPDLSNTLFQMATSIKPNDTRSLLGKEIPGLSTYGYEIIVAGEGTNYSNLPIESAPPLEEVLKDRKAVVEETKQTDSNDKENKNENHKENKNENQLSTDGKNVVFIYNTHNTESFLPYLPGVEDPDLAHHSKMNVTKISDRLAKHLEQNGIGTKVAQADIMGILDKKGWEYGQAYAASRNVVQQTVASNDDIQYIIDIHRDAQPRDITTVEIKGKKYARVMFVVGGKYDNYKENVKLAHKLDKLIEKKYPGLSRGVIVKKGKGSNGVYNQDLTGNALLIEFGGVGNKMDELYRTADVVADAFSELYWDAEKVNKAK